MTRKAEEAEALYALTKCVVFEGQTYKDLSNSMSCHQCVWNRTDSHRFCTLHCIGTPRGSWKVVKDET